MRYVCLLAVMVLVLTVPALSAQDGAAIYKERCASCHDMPQGRTPGLSAIKAMSGEAIYIALTNGAMKTQAQGLSTVQIFMLLGYIAPTGGSTTEAASVNPTCKSPAPFGRASFNTAMSGPRWNGWSTTITNSRFQDARSAGLTASNVPKLKLKWAFNLGDVTMARSQPTIVGGRVFIGSLTGVVYSLDADSGCTRWGFKAAAAIRSGVTLSSANGTPAVFFGDSGATVYAVNAETGDAKPPVCAPGQAMCSPAQSAAVTAIPGVVFSGSLDGHLRAYSTATGAVLWDVDTAREYQTVNGTPARGGSIDVAGPAVVNGMVFVNSGYGQWGGMPGNVLLVFSVDGR